MEETARKRGRRGNLWLFALAVLALGLRAARTPDMPREVLVAKYGQPPSKIIRLPNGAQVHYRDQGPAGAPVLLLLHGSSSSLHTWEPWVERLRDALRIVTLDLPGHGLTGPVPGDDYSPDGMVGFVEVFRNAVGLSHFF